MFFKKKPFKGKKIASLSDETLSISIFENKALRWFSFDPRYIQSAINKIMPSKPVMHYIPAFCLPLSRNTIDSCLLLGAGAGAFWHYHQQHYSACALTAIEHSALVIQAAEQYFFLPNGALILDDALHFVASTQQKYDCVFVDLFASDSLPALSYNEHFIALCKKNARHSVSFNLLCNNPENLRALYITLKNQFQHHTLSLIIPNTTNIIVHAFIDRNSQLIIEELLAAKVISPPKWDPLMGVVAEYTAKGLEQTGSKQC